MDRIRRKLNEINEKIDVTKHRVSEEKLGQSGLTGITLRPYQLEGVNWIIERYHRNHGCILGDEMGLGKTCQTISFLTYLHGKGSCKGPCLIVSPLSVIPNWRNELTRFAPKLSLEVYIGDKDKRAEMREEMDDFDVLLTTYELCLKDTAFLSKHSWFVLVVDEAHRLKNQNSLLYQTLSEFDINHRVLLTGTPVQNNLTELYALLCFVAPTIFRIKYCEEFVDTFSDIKDDSKEAAELHALLQPFLLRRVKSEVVLDLPKKSEVLLYHNLTELQKKYYKAILMKDIEAFQNPDGSNKTRFNNILVQLRKCVNHPYLFDGVEPEPFELGEHLIKASGKLHLLDQLLSFLKARDHKVLLFSQMTRMLDILQDYLGYRGYNYERLDGSVRGEERFLAVQNFNKQEDTFIFLLSTKAGGQGLNLVSADTVIFVDSDFNPQNDIQAAARAHRIGQTKPVKIIRLVGKDTVDEIILKRADAKLKLTNTVIEGGQFSLGASNQAETPQSLSDMLKFGLDKLFGSTEKGITEKDLQRILGASVNGEWQLEEEEEEAVAMESDEDEEEAEDVNMYVFEGKDYSRPCTTSDEKAFDELMAAELETRKKTLAAPMTLRKYRTAPELAVAQLPTRKRKELTDEEKAERARKRKEAAAKRARLQEEEEIRKAQERRKRRDEMWKAKGYESCNIAMETDSEDEEEEEGGTDIVLGTLDEEKYVKTAINYVSGDVTHPVNTEGEDAIIVHCVDDSGRWGSGGLFSAISARSPQPAQQYQVAGQMQDLALGDAHMIGIDDLQSREDGRDVVALIVAQHRDRQNRLSGIKLLALSQGLQRVYKEAKKKSASVHLPRIGYATPGFNWYGTERLIRKHLAAKGIPTYIYYFPRKNRNKTSSRKNSLTGQSSDDPKPSTSLDTPARKKNSVQSDTDEEGSDPGPSTSHDATVNTQSSFLPDFLAGVTVYFHNISEEDQKKVTRFLVAYDGCVDDQVTIDTTHLIGNSDEDCDVLQSLGDKNSKMKMVSMQWLEDCIAKNKKLSEDPYRIDV
ncbi:chromodomain-helicase-DNA-binding protein 1-like [Ptychodera flava]|uniref:chromodomain-helicase-DNA-binding protein 1-like n=1 Tax=Ptychodera flava TaxID=63121 RepID=UPI003969E558